MHHGVGDAVCALVSGGGYAAHCVAPEAQCLPVPAGFSMVEAAALPETFFTVWHNLFERGRLAAGESVLIHGGSSGIGTTAIMLARAFGARHIFATAGTPEKCRACEALGATRAIDYKQRGFRQSGEGSDRRQAASTSSSTWSAADYIQRDLSALAVDGRLVFIAFLGGAAANVNFVSVMLKRLTITGSTLRARSVADKGRDRRGAAKPGLAAARCRQVPAGHLSHFPAGRRPRPPTA